LSGYSDAQLVQALQTQLQPGEQVRTAAYAEAGMPFWAKLVCFVVVIFTVIPGLILFLVWNVLAKKNFVVALTDRRLIVLEVGSALAPKQIWDYPLPIQGRVAIYPSGRGFHWGQQIDISAARARPTSPTRRPWRRCWPPRRRCWRRPAAATDLRPRTDLTRAAATARLRVGATDHHRAGAGAADRTGARRSGPRLRQPRSTTMTPCTSGIGSWVSPLSSKMVTWGAMCCA
jgi:hypothetical protein